ncbi:OB-fold nucleic acid binding domain-containing protein [Prevotella sp.]|uniref:OB-fold nucleic acid binding domain-containing protein n=1 Tax=Prevotella sp. TaxID=59823 RepID=UPI002F93E1EE
MKNLFNSLFVLAIAAMTFTSCEDVPMPYDMPTVNGGSVTPSPEEKALDPAGKGTKEDPYNVAAAVKLAKALADKAVGEQEVYVKGVVKSLDSKNENAIKTYGNATFVITDGAEYTQEFTVFQCLFLNKKKFTSTDQIKEGDTVIICGKLSNYGGKPETEGKGKSYVYALNDQTSSDTPVVPPVTDNSADKPYSVAKSLELITGGKAPEAEVYVKGIISKAPTFNSKYGSLTYYISDDGKTEKELQIFSGLSFNGAKFTSDKDLQVGQTVVVLGVIKAYTNTTTNITVNEMDKNNKLISVDGKTELKPGA